MAKYNYLYQKASGNGLVGKRRATIGGDTQTTDGRRIHRRPARVHPENGVTAQAVGSGPIGERRSAIGGDG